MTDPRPHWGIFGGSFDPPHLGHQRAAFEALELLRLDGVLWVPTPQNPLKPAVQANAAVRRELTAAAIADVAAFALCTIELDGPAPAYTAATVGALAAKHPDRRWTLILGADAWCDFAAWHQPLTILSHAELAVVVRPQTACPEPRTVLQSLDTNGSFCYDRKREDDDWTLRFFVDDAPRTTRIRFLNSTALAISSTAIRAMIAAGRDPRYLLSDRVYNVVEGLALYGFRRR